MYVRGEPSGEEAPWYAPLGTMKHLLFLILDIVVFAVIVVAPAIPYLKQYSIIKSTREVGAFSIYVCAIVLYGQVFRILFWYDGLMRFYSHFLLSMLVQSVVMILLHVVSSHQMALLKACVEAEHKNPVLSSVEVGPEGKESRRPVTSDIDQEVLAVENLSQLYHLFLLHGGHL